MNLEQLKQVEALGPEIRRLGLSTIESVDFIAERLKLSDVERRGIKIAAVACIKPWQEVEDGIDCECGSKAQWTSKRISTVKDKLGYDIFPFQCPDCKKVILRRWRAPSLDGLNDFTSYEVTYTREIKTE